MASGYSERSHMSKNAINLAAMTDRGNFSPAPSVAPSENDYRDKLASRNSSLQGYDYIKI